LEEDEGPEGLGWLLTTAAYGREGGPALHHGSYCTRCRDDLAGQGVVLCSDEDQGEWLRGPHPAYGVWSVWDDDPTEQDPDFEPKKLGVYRGFVDEIAGACYFSDRQTMWFQRESADASAVAAPETEPNDMPECVGVNVIRDGGSLADTPDRLEAFFRGRPVFVRYSEYGHCVAVYPKGSPYHDVGLERRTRLRAVLSKLTPDDVLVLKENGLKV
jgi:hypothetical protein